MKKMLLFAAIAASLVAVAVPVSVTNEVLTVDQNGIPSVPGVLGTVSDLARLQAATEIAAAQAASAESVYAATTQLLSQVAKEFIDRNVVVYRKYYMDAFTATIIIGDDDKCAIYGWQTLPSAQQDQPGRVKYKCSYACTADILSITGIFKSNSNVTSNRADWAYLDSQYVTDVTTDPSRSTFTDKDGNVYNYCYQATVSIPSEIAHFVVINIPNQSADSDGSTVVIYGGVKDGINTTIVDGTMAYDIVGGLVVGAREAN